MIIRMSKAEQSEIDAINQEYNSQIDELTNRIIISDDNAKEDIITAIKELNLKRNVIISEKYQAFEERRFNNIKQSPQRIEENAFKQVDAIIDELINLTSSFKPQTPQERENQLRRFNRTLTEEQLLSQIKPIPPLFHSMLNDIESSAGEIHKLSADQIVILIQTDLHRHYSRLDASAAGRITDYIEKKVSDTIKTNPDFQYLPITKDMVFRSIVPAIAKKQKLTSNGATVFYSNGVRYSFTNKYIDNKYVDGKHSLSNFGQSAMLLFMMAQSEFTRNPNQNNDTVSFPTIPFMTECGLNVSNKKTLANAIYDYRHGPLAALRSIEVSIDKTDKNNLPDLTDMVIVQKTNINKDRITLQFGSDYAEYLRSVRQKGFFPSSFFANDSHDLNTMAIKNKLWDNATQYNNILSGQAEIISIRSLIKETSLSDVENIDGRYASRKKDRSFTSLKNNIENALKSKEFKPNWYYCKSKGLRLNSVETQEAKEDLYKFRGLYIHYEIQNEEFWQMLIDNATERREKRIAAKERRDQVQIIQAEKALRRLQRERNNNA